MTEQDRADLAAHIHRKKAEWARQESARGKNTFIPPVASSGASKPLLEGLEPSVSVPSERQAGLQPTVDVNQELYKATDDDIPF